MGLPASQRRVLEEIEHALRASDPRFASLFAIFGRLTRDEDMPRIEELRHRVVVAVLRLRLVLAASRPRRVRRRVPRPPRQRLVLFFPVALALMALMIMAAARFGGAGTCTAITATSSAAKQVPKSRLCRPPVLIPGFAGR